MNVTWTNTASKRHRLVIIALSGLATFLQACATPLPQNAYPIEPKISAVLGTTEFVVYSNIKYTNGCRLVSLGCYTDFWQVCIRFNNAAAYKKATRNNYAGPDSDFDFAMKSGSTMFFRDGEWYLDLGAGCNLPTK
jgi:hypothetical protein